MTTNTPQHQHRRRSKGPRPFTVPQSTQATPTVRDSLPILTPAERYARNAAKAYSAKARKHNNVVQLFGKSDYYHCPELLQNPGIPAARFAAYQLPSRSGDWLYYPDGRAEPFPGSPPWLAQQAGQSVSKP